MALRPSRLAAGSALVAALALGRPALAQANDAAAAEGLFEDGKRLMAAGQFAAACPKFAESQRLDPGIGTLLWLADCYSKNGQAASAWAIFKEAEALAAKQHDPRAKIAREEARRVEPHVSKLVLEVPADAPGLVVKRDGIVLGRPLWGTAIPTDAGSHRILASAPDKLPWQTDVVVPKDGGSVSVRVPALEAAPPPPPPPAGVAAKAAPVEGDTKPEPELDESVGRAQRVSGIVVVAAGVVGAGVGTYFGLRVRTKRDDSNAHCNGNVCDQAGFDLRRDALHAATAANIAFAAAGVAIVGGAILYFTAPSPSRRAAFGVAPLAEAPGGSFVGAF